MGSKVLATRRYKLNKPPQKNESRMTTLQQLLNTLPQQGEVTWIGLNQKLSIWLRRFFEARSLGERLSSFSELKFRDVRLHIPSITNRTTGLSMGEHCELMAKCQT